MRQDPGWEAFRVELDRQLRTTNLSSAALAGKMGIDPEQVRLWLYGRQHPPLKRLPAIAKALELPEWHFPCEWGFCLGPTRPALARACRVLELEHQRQHLLERLSEQGEATGAALVVREAVDRGWAVSVWPAHEGPPELRLHVADRLTFHQAVGPDAPRDPLVDLREALQRVGAVPVIPSNRRDG